MGFSPNIDLFLTIAPLVIASIGLVYYGRKKMQRLGIVYVIIFYTKWFLGVVVTMCSFYALFMSANYLTDLGYSAVFSLPVGAAVWFIPMNYISKYFGKLEEKYKKKDLEE